MPRGSPCRTRPARRCAPTPRGGSSRRTPAAPSTSTPSFTSSPDRRGTGPWWLVPAMRPRLPAIVEVPTGRRHPRPAPRLRHQAPPAGCADGRAPRSRRPGVGARPCRGDRNPRRDRRRASGGQRGLDDPGLGPQGGPRRPGLGHAGRVAGGEDPVVRLQPAGGVLGEVYLWSAAESAVVKGIRRHLGGEIGVDRKRVPFMGYGKRGATL